MDQKYYGDMFKSKANPMITGTFSIEHTTHNGIMELSLHLFYSIIERMLGGDGKNISPARPMTDFERALTREIFTTALGYHKDILENYFSCDFKINHIDTDTLMIPKTQSEDEVLIRLVYNVNLDGVVGYLNICFPYNLLGPYFGRYSGGSGKEERKESNISRDKVQKQFGSIRVPVSVEFAKRKITAHQLSEISTGSIITLTHKVEAPLNVVVNGKIKFLGKPGVKGDRMGVRITRAYEKEAMI